MMGLGLSPLIVPFAELKLIFCNDLATPLVSFNRTVRGIETLILEGVFYNILPLIVPFAELKHPSFFADRGISEPLIVPFAELKLGGQYWYLGFYDHL